jgi:hypothetical protein
MRAYIVIEALAVLAISAGVYAANTQIEQAPPRSDKRGQAMGSPQELIQSNRVSCFVAPRIFPRSFDTPSSRPDA